MSLGTHLAQEILAVLASDSGSRVLLSISTDCALFIGLHLEPLQKTIDDEVGLQVCSTT